MDIFGRLLDLGMKKLASVVLTVLVLSGWLASGRADAAKPRSGGLNYKVRTLKWSGGPFNVSYPTTELACAQGASDPFCDHYKLKVNMGQGAKIQIAIKSSRSGLEAGQGIGGLTAAPNDFDMFLFDPGGHQVTSAGTFKGDEKMRFLMKSKYRNKAYEVRIVPFLIVPGTTYKGTITTLKYVK
jgi:hypothetical protein